jgi:transposase-like protein
LCRKDFTIVTNTVFGETKLPLKKWFIAIYLLSTTSKGISSVQLAKHVGCTQKTGWFVDHRIRKALKENGGQLFGTFEADETFIGGLEKNKHKSKRKHIGTGGTGKTPIFGIRNRDGKTHARVVKSVTSKDLHAIIRESVARGSILYTDSWCGYNNLKKDFNHTVINHSEGTYVIGDAHTNGIESFWALFKRGYHGVYHQMSRKHMQRYVDEFIFRFNRRGQPSLPVFFRSGFQSCREREIALQRIDRMSRPRKIHKPIKVDFNSILAAVATGDKKGKKQSSKKRK